MRPDRGWKCDIAVTALPRPSGREIQNSLAMHGVYGDGHMIVHDQPDAFDFPEARRPTQPHVDVTARQRGVYVVEAVNEGQIAVRRDLQVKYLISDGAAKTREGFSPGSPFPFSPEGAQRR